MVVLQGQNVQLQVVANGAAPLAYQWYFNDDILTGQTSSILSIPNVTVANGGIYIVTVSNGQGAVFSDEAKLTVLIPPVINTPPANLTLTAGSTATFTVSAGGSEPLSYQWKKGTSAVPDATNDTLVLLNVQVSDSGSYTVTVTNRAGKVTSSPAVLTVGDAPVILTQPSSLTVTQSHMAVFSVSAIGSAPLTYQWRLGNVDLPGKTSSDLTLLDVQPANAGIYTVVVSNDVGKVTSAGAVLTVLEPPRILVQPTSLTVTQGLEAVFGVNAAGTEPLKYQWYLDGTTLLTGKTNPVLNLANVQGAQAGSYSVVVSNQAGTVTSSAAVLTVLVPPSIVIHPSNRNVFQGNNALFGVTAAGTAPFFYQWMKDGVDMPGRTNFTLNLSNVQPPDAGVYRARVSNVAGEVLSNPATLTVIEKPTIVVQPSSLEVVEGNPAALSVTAAGAQPLRYQWYLNNTTPVSGGTNELLTFTSARAADAGNYRVVVSNVVGSVTSEVAVLTVRLKPSIVTPPALQVVALGGTATFFVVAAGDAPLSYQWRFNGADLPGETRTNLVLANVQASHLGPYSVLVSNPYGTAVGGPALLTLEEPPSIVTHPVNTTVPSGQNATFTVAVNGSVPLSFQWFLNQTQPVPGGTNQTLVLSNVTVTMAGAYSVRVTNPIGAATSNPGTLTVLGAPVVVTQPADIVTTNRGQATFTVNVAGPGPLTYVWFRDTTSVSSPSANPNFLINPVTPASAGNYHVVVTNLYGSVTSASGVLTVLTEDFGDAPDPSYATLRASNGPRHLLTGALQLGAAIDFENDGQPGASATGDDTAGLDDEDGVVFDTLLVANRTAGVTVQASAPGLLQGWVDFNRNGSWAENGEKVFTNLALVAGSQHLSFNVPASIVPGGTFARFRFSSAASLGVGGPAPDGEVEDCAVALFQESDLGLTMTGTTGPIAVGGNITYVVTVTNRGPVGATGVLLTNLLPTTTTYISAVPTQGSCTESGNIVTCTLGNLAVNGQASVTVIVRSPAAGTKTNVAMVGANQADLNQADNRASFAVGAIYTHPTFANGDALLLPEIEAGPAQPYPSPIIVSGITSTVYKVTVTLGNISHSFPDDIDVLLVGPGGQSMILMSDAGSGFFTPISNVTLTFDDAATQDLPNSDTIVSGTYRPTNHGSALDDVFPPPAPSRPYGQALSVFNGTDPNGTWLLYVVDDLPEDFGFIADGWTLTITSLEPMANLGVTLADAPDPVSITSNLTYTVTVTNQGPSRATDIVVVQTLPAGASFVSATVDQGSCVFNGGIVTCTLPALNPSQSKPITVRVTPTQAGTASSTVTVASAQSDLYPLNNTASATTTVKLVGDLKLASKADVEPVLLGQGIVYTLSVTNAGPYDTSSVQLTNQLPAGIQWVSSLASQGACSTVGQTVTCNLGTLAMGVEAEVKVNGLAVATGLMTNVTGVASAQADPNLADNLAKVATTVVPAADLIVWQSHLPEPVVVSQNLNYTLIVSNRGPSQTAGVVLTDPIPNLSAYVDAIPTQGKCTNDNGLLRCDLGVLAAGAAATVQLQTATLLSGWTTNVAHVVGTAADPHPQDNRSEAAVLINPAADLALEMVDDPDPILLGDALTFTLTIKNHGPDAASNVSLTDALPPQVDFISALPTQGNCTNDLGTVRCQLGALASGAQAVVSLIVLPTVPGSITNKATAAALEADLVPANNQATTDTAVQIDTGLFSNTTGLVIPDAGPAVPYPSTIQVSGVVIRVDQVSVTISNLSHTYPDDLDLLLVGPLGQSALLMSDVGGGTAASHVTLKFSDEANVAIPDEGPLVGGTFRPTNGQAEPDVFPAPAPAGPYGQNLSVFNGLDPNGTWSLYVLDDFAKDSGSILDGWTLQFTTLELLADLALTASAQPSPVAVSSNLTYAINVTNRGPAVATGVMVTNTLPAGVDVLGIASTQGACNNDQGVVVCSLGTLAARAGARMTVEVRVNAAGTLNQSAHVVGVERDLNPANNTAATVVSALAPPVITTEPAGLVVTEGETAVLTVTATGAQPLSYQWLFNDTPLAGATSSTLELPNASGQNTGLYQVRVSNAVGTVHSAQVQLTVLVPVRIVTQPLSQLVNAGSTVHLSVGVTGSTPLGYRWFFNNVELPGEIDPMLTIPSVQSFNAGDYQVIVANSLNAATSVVARLTITQVDFGDAPLPRYPTLLAANGARHRVVPGVHLGALVDLDPDGVPHLQGLGDDQNGVDDEDGVTFLGPLVPSQTATVQVVASTNGLLNTWIDFDASGDWTSANEHVFTDLPVNAGTNVLNFVVPVTAIESSTAFARFRFGTTPGLSYEGEAPDGEVEDHAVTIVRAADLAVTMRANPNPVAVNFNLVYSIGITNLGPLTASNVNMTSLFAGNATLLSAVPSQGNCSLFNSPSCSLGNLSPGQGLSVSVVYIMLKTGYATNQVSVIAREFDFNLPNNVAHTETRVVDFPRIQTPPSNTTAVQGTTATMSVVATGTDLFFQWRLNDVDVHDATNATLSIPNVQPSNEGSYSVRVSNFLGSTVGGPATLTVLLPPAITAQPQSVTVPYGDPVTFAVTAQGTPPLAYQWSKDGVRLTGRTLSTLVIAGAQAIDAGDYTVLVSGPGGSVGSQPATLKFTGPPVVILHPQSRTNNVGSTATFVAKATGSDPLAYQWFLNNNPISGATADTLTLPNVQLTSAGNYHVRVSNGQAQVLSATAVLTVYEMDFGDAPDPSYFTLLSRDGARHRIVNGMRLGTAIDLDTDGQPNATATGDDTQETDDEDGVVFTQPLVAGDMSEVTVTASGSGLLNAWIDFNGDGVWSSPGERIFTDRALTTGANVLSFQVPSSATARETFARFRFSTAAGLGPEGFAPNGEVEDTAVSIRLKADLLVSVSGGPSPVATGSPVQYLITVRNNGPANAVGTVLTNQLDTSMNFNSAVPTQGDCQAAGSVVRCTLGAIHPGEEVVVTLRATPGSSGMATNVALVFSPDLDLNPANNQAETGVRVVDPPVITQQPQSLTVTNGDPAVFTVAVAGGQPFSFQWRFNGSLLPGETGPSLTLPAARQANAGLYTVTVSNEVGQRTSDPATLAVLFPVIIATHPQSHTNFAGQATSFLVEFFGAQPVTIQWYANNLPVPGGTGAQLNLNNVQPADAGPYSVVLSNPINVVTSQVATLTVLEADFGDAPAGYPTTFAAHGAYHLIVPALRLGASVDSDPDGQPNANANGDDTDGNDDDNGVTFSATLLLGQNNALSVTASAAGILQGWVDWNGNGSWADPGEQVYVDRPLVAGANALGLTVPNNAVAGLTFARFRFSSAPGLSFDGPAVDGEVEDYAMRLSSDNVALEITLIERRANGTVRIEFIGPSSGGHEVWASTDLANWTKLGTATSLGGATFEFIDTGAPGFAARFYKVGTP